MISLPEVLRTEVYIIWLSQLLGTRMILGSFSVHQERKVCEYKAEYLTSCKVELSIYPCSILLRRQPVGFFISCRLEMIHRNLQIFCLIHEVCVEHETTDEK